MDGGRVGSDLSSGGDEWWMRMDSRQGDAMR